MSENQSESVVTTVEQINLEVIIQERKAERRVKAEEKREADLQRIRDMRSATGIDPLQRFPKEIWKMIFDELGPEDLGNVWQVHPMFRDVLRSNRDRDILFPQVLKIGGFWGHLRRTSESQIDEHLRLVSRRMRDSYDLRNEDDLMKRLQEDEASGSTCPRQFACFYLHKKEDHRKLKRMLVNFGEDVENRARRFFPRAIFVSIADLHLVRDLNPPEGQPRITVRQIFNEFKRNILALLKLIGDQVWHFSFEKSNLVHFEYSLSYTYKLLRNWVSLMPNLKWLEVCIEPRSRVIYEENDDDLGFGEESFSTAYSVIEENPFPCLRHLERLNLREAYRNCSEKRVLNIYEVVLGANPHVKSLDLCHIHAFKGDEESPDDFPILPEHLTQALVDLQSFSVFGDQEDDDVDEYQPSLQRVRLLTSSTWPLKTIILGLTETNFCSLTSVFRFLEQFPTLETMKLIRMAGFSIGNTDEIGYLKLPNLTDVELAFVNPQINYDTNIHFFFSLQFLVNCKNLKRISWHMNGFEGFSFRNFLQKQESENQGKMLDFRAGMRNLYDSNIWSVFPSLEEVDVGIKRKGYKGCFHTYMRGVIGQSVGVSQLLNTYQCTGRAREISCFARDRVRVGR